MYGNDLSSRSRTLNGGRWRLTRLCSTCSASASLPVTITSRSAIRSRSPRVVGPVLVAAALEVAAHARPQRLRLADVEDLARAVAKQVDAGLGREPASAGPRARCAIRPSVDAQLLPNRSLMTRVLGSDPCGGDSSSRRSPRSSSPPPRTPAARPSCVGAAEDIVKQPDLLSAKAQMDLARLAGMRAIRSTAIWAPGQTAPDPTDLTALQNAADAAQLDGITLYVSIYQFGSKTTPLTDQDQSDFAAFAASLATALPTVRRFIVGNEPNINRFWLPQFGLDGEDVAARRLRAAARPHVRRAEGGLAADHACSAAPSRRAAATTRTRPQTHSPTAFIRDMGAAYRASGRTRRSWTPSPSTRTWTTRASRRCSSTRTRRRSRSTTTASSSRCSARPSTAPRSAGSTLPVLYDEFGVESRSRRPRRRSTRAASRRRRSRATRCTQAALYRAGDRSSRSASRTCEGIFLFHTRRRAGARPLAVGPLLRGRDAEGEPRPGPGRDRRGAARRDRTLPRAAPPRPCDAGSRSRRRGVQARPRRCSRSASAATSTARTARGSSACRRTRPSSPRAGRGARRRRGPGDSCRGGAAPGPLPLHAAARRERQPGPRAHRRVARVHRALTVQVCSPSAESPTVYDVAASPSGLLLPRRARVRPPGRRGGCAAHARRRGRGRGQAARPRRRQGEDGPRAARRVQRDPDHDDLGARPDRADRERAQPAAERGRRGRPRRDHDHPLGLPVGRRDDPAHAAGARRLRRLLRLARPSAAERAALHRRQRAEREPLLVAAVRPEGRGSRGPRLRAAAGRRATTR